MTEVDTYRSPMNSPEALPPDWVQLVRPVATPTLQPITPGSGAVAWYAEVQFSLWRAPVDAPKLPWAVTYGKTQIVGDDGEWSVAEIELVRRMRSGGWNAGWIDTFGSAPKAWSSWLLHPGELPTELRRAFNAITNDTGTTGKGGSPDVIAWRDGRLQDAVFIEYKGPSDKVRPGQDLWLRAALRSGLTPEQFLVAKWRKRKA
jgi:hypothetical protein